MGDRWLYDTTVVSMAPCLLFAPDLTEVHRGQRVVFQFHNWYVAVDPKVADDLLALRGLVVDFVGRSVGQTLTKVHTDATDALGRLFSDHAALEGGDDDDELGVSLDELRSAQDEATGAGSAAIAIGESVEAYWPDNDAWLPATIQVVSEDGYEV